MAKTVKFADPNTTMMHVAGWGKVDKTNLTEEVYEHLIKMNPSHEKLFIVTDEGKKGVSPKPTE